MTDHETILTALADGLTAGKAARALGSPRPRFVLH